MPILFLTVRGGAGARPLVNFAVNVIIIDGVFLSKRDEVSLLPLKGTIANRYDIFQRKVVIMNERVYNFAAGPAVLPLPVLKKAQEELQSQVNSIGDELKSAQIEVKDKLNALAVQNLRTGAVVCAQISQKQQMLGIFGKILDSAKARYDEKPDDERVKKRYEGIKHNYDSIEKDVNLLSSFYGDFISSAALSFPQKLIEDNFDEAVTSFGSTENARAMVNYDEYMEIYTAHLKKYRANHSDLKKEQKIWIEQCTVNAARAR